MASNNSGIAGRSLFVWLAVTALAAGATFGRVEEAAATSSLFLMGFLLAGSVVITRTLAGRACDVSTVVLVLWAGTFGFWAQHWFGVVQVGIGRWLTGPGHVSEAIGVQLVVPLAIATAGIATAALMRVDCSSTTVVALTVLASLAAAAAPFTPFGEGVTLPIAAVLWHSLVTAGLCHWATDTISRRSAGRCAHCGTDVAGLASPVCPHCDRPLARAPLAHPAIAAGTGPLNLR